ncbi:MAG: molybdopterin molybdotransferase MoeA [Candidatus Nitrosocosmicus sp.]
MVFKNDSYRSVNYAFTKLCQNMQPCLETALVPVFESKGCVLKEDVISNNNIPPYSSSHMDGFALKSEDTIHASESNPIALKISNGKSILGVPPSDVLKSGESYRIQTGGYLPNSTDAVVPVEHVRIVGYDSIEILSPTKKGSFVYPAGTDIKEGEKVLSKGQVLRAQEMALLAFLNISMVPTFRKPIIAIIPTGTELTDDVEENKKNKTQKIINTNGPILSCIIEEMGGIPLNFAVTPDKMDILEKNIKIALKKSDIVITLGGSSVGEHDIVETTINSFGTPGVLVHGVKLDRGRVSGLGVINGKPIFMLPGPIQGALNAFIVFVRPLVRMLSGLSQKSDVEIVATITENWQARKKFFDFTKILYVNVSRNDDRFLAKPVIGETQSMSLLTKSNGYIIIPEEVTSINAGEKYEVNLLPGFSYIGDSWIC